MTPDEILGRDMRPSEEFPLSWDFTNDLPTGDTIANKQVTAQDSDGVDVSATFLQNPGISGNKVSVQVQGGVAGRDYTVVFEATTAAGHIFRRRFLVKCRD